MANSTKYFQKFPITPYKGVPSLNIMKRTNFNSDVRGFLSVFYNYTMNEGERIESLAHDYYDDVDYDWIIHHVNSTIDPYYQVSLPSSSFERYIKKKYGSIRLAQQRIAFFENNFRQDDRILSSSDFENLDKSELKYWKPIENAFGTIGYERDDNPFRASTNIIINLDFDEQQPLKVGELVKKTDDDSAFAEVVWSSPTACVLHHVRGDFESGTLIGDESGVTVNIENPLVTDIIPSLERQYYRAVSFYDFEERQNEDKREIFLVDRTYADQLNKQLNELLR